jgi:hypothetical protein
MNQATTWLTSWPAHGGQVVTLGIVVLVVRTPAGSAPRSAASWNGRRGGARRGRSRGTCLGRSGVAEQGRCGPITRPSQRFQNPWDGMRKARLKREDAFSHAMIIVISAMVSSS